MILEEEEMHLFICFDDKNRETAKLKTPEPSEPLEHGCL